MTLFAIETLVVRVEEEQRLYGDDVCQIVMSVIKFRRYKRICKDNGRVCMTPTIHFTPQPSLLPRFHWHTASETLAVKIAEE